MPRVAKLSVTERNVRKSPCPTCGAQPGDRCTRPSGSTTAVAHFPRREAAIAAGYHTP
jgi:hypothetical protein